MLFKNQTSGFGEFPLALASTPLGYCLISCQKTVFQ